MDRFEDDLRRALRDTPPTPDLASRVASAVGQRAATSRPRWFRTWKLAAIAAALIAVVGVLALRFENQRRERLAAERAKQDVLLALRITRAKLQVVEDRLVYDTQH